MGQSQGIAPRLVRRNIMITKNVCYVSQLGTENSWYAYAFEIMVSIQCFCINMGKVDLLCDLCDKVFSKKAYLTKHKITCLEEFNCEKCQKVLTSKKTLKEHMKMSLVCMLSL